MRKMLLALVMMFFMAGLVVAVEVTALSYDKEKKELKVKDEDKPYKVGDSTKFYTTDAKGENKKESSLAAFEKSFGKIGKKGRKLEVTVKDGTVTEATWKAGGKKKKN